MWSWGYATVPHHVSTACRPQLVEPQPWFLSNCGLIPAHKALCRSQAGLGRVELATSRLMGRIRWVSLFPEDQPAEEGNARCLGKQIHSLQEVDADITELHPPPESSLLENIHHLGVGKTAL